MEISSLTSFTKLRQTFKVKNMMDHQQIVVVVKYDFWNRESAHQLQTVASELIFFQKDNYILLYAWSQKLVADKIRFLLSTESWATFLFE